MALIGSPGEMWVMGVSGLAVAEASLSVVLAVWEAELVGVTGVRKGFALDDKDGVAVEAGPASE